MSSPSTFTATPLCLYAVQTHYRGATGVVGRSGEAAAADVKVTRKGVGGRQGRSGRRVRA